MSTSSLSGMAVYFVNVPGSELRKRALISDNRLLQDRIAGCYEQVFL